MLEWFMNIFQTVTHEKPNESSHYIENYCNYINAFTDSISFDELFDNMLNCKPRKNPRKAIIKQIRTKQTAEWENSHSERKNYH